MKIRMYIAIPLLATCALFAGCELLGFLDGDGLDRGTFKVQVKGYVDDSFRGRAVFETLHGLGGEPVFFLMLQDIDEPGEKYRIVRFADGPRPDVGSYSLANLEKPDEVDPSKFWGSYDDSEHDGSFRSAGGTLNISFASEERLKGSFDFPAFELVPIGGGEFTKVEVRITGEFHAEEGVTGIDIN